MLKGAVYLVPGAIKGQLWGTARVAYCRAGCRVHEQQQAGVAAGWVCPHSTVRCCRKGGGMQQLVLGWTFPPTCAAPRASRQQLASCGTLQAAVGFRGMHEVWRQGWWAYV